MTMIIFHFVLTRYGTITAFTTDDTDTVGALGVDLENFIAANDDGGSGKNFLITRKLGSGNILPRRRVTW